MATKKHHKKRDRTKHGLTPKRRDLSPAPKRTPTPAWLLQLIGAVIGPLFLFGGALQTLALADVHSRPELRMTVGACETHHRSKDSVTSCYGTGDPGAPVTGAGLLLRQAPEEYPAGTVVKVRCAQDGICDVITAGRLFITLLTTVAGLLIMGATLVALTLRAVDRFAPHRSELLRTRRVHRGLARTGIGTVLLAVTGSLLFIFL
ncbi:hypothetical protein [Kitasatospora sp. NPDC048407]|uniref:hypothetical protein n=1 Tax=Kitasatospora sp. NPDC048407 TaxID=3364051 RepID=UPI003724927A